MLIAYAMSFMLVYSNGPCNIFAAIRHLLGKIHSTVRELFDCIFCTATWVGFTLSLINTFLLREYPFTPMNLYFQDMEWWIKLIGDGCITASIAYILNTIMEAIETISIRKEE